MSKITIDLPEGLEHLTLDDPTDYKKAINLLKYISLVNESTNNPELEVTHHVKRTEYYMNIIIFSDIDGCQKFYALDLEYNIIRAEGENLDPKLIEIAYEEEKVEKIEERKEDESDEEDGEVNTTTEILENLIGRIAEVADNDQKEIASET